MTYIVQNGDTIESIATRMGVSTEALMEQNRLTIAEELLPGMVLTIEERLWPQDFEELPYCCESAQIGQPSNACSAQNCGDSTTIQPRTLSVAQPTNLLDYTKPTPPPPGWDQSQETKPNRPGKPNAPLWPPRPNRPPWQNAPQNNGTIILRPNRPTGGLGTPTYGEPNIQNANYTWNEGKELRYLLFTNKYRYRAGEQIAITFRKRNIGTQSIALRYPSGQLFDFYISDSRGMELWRWSDGVTNNNVEREIILAPNQAEVMTVVWDQHTKTGQRVPPQILTIWGVNLAGEIAIPLEIQIY